MSSIDEKFMRIAIIEAKKSESEVNKTSPKVGAVIVRNNEILAQTHRGETGQGHHAEYIALERKLTGEDLSDTVLYTTLEPCTVRNHGKKGSYQKLPCAKWIVSRKIKHVVIGMIDPNPNICGKGILYLKENNVRIDYFPSDLQSEIEEMNKDFSEDIKKKYSDEETLSMDKPSTYERNPLDNSTVEDFSEELIRRYCERNHIDLKIPSDRLWQFFLKNNYLIFNKEKNKTIPTVAGILLFGKNPEYFLPQAIIKAVKYQGFEEDVILDTLKIKGSILEIIRETENFLRRNMRIGYNIIDFTREEVTEYPLEALREAIVNAILHRDYEMGGATVILQMFKDRIVVESPGLLPRPLTLEKIRSLNYRPYSRNPIIARTINNDTIYMEELGSGIRRMYNSMLNYNLREPHFDCKGGYFSVTFYGPGEIFDIRSTRGNKIYEINISKQTGLNNRQKNILKFLLENEKITSRDCIEKFGITRETANRDLNKLIKKELVEQKGIGRSTCYILKE